MARYHKIDGWRGYWIPQYAVMGASDTGTWSDSPANSDRCKAEITKFCKALRKALGIKVRQGYGSSTNVFCGKRWATVSKADFPAAAQFAVDWMEEHKHDTRLIHTADLEVLGYKPTAEAA